MATPQIELLHATMCVLALSSVLGMFTCTSDNFNKAGFILQLGSRGNACSSISWFNLDD
jgi:hypothetical protein